MPRAAGDAAARLGALAPARSRASSVPTRRGRRAGRWPTRSPSTVDPIDELDGHAGRAERDARPPLRLRDDWRGPARRGAPPPRRGRRRRRRDRDAVARATSRIAGADAAARPATRARRPRRRARRDRRAAGGRVVEPSPTALAAWRSQAATRSPTPAARRAPTALLADARRAARPARRLHGQGRPRSGASRTATLAALHRRAHDALYTAPTDLVDRRRARPRLPGALARAGPVGRRR